MQEIAQLLRRAGHDQPRAAVGRVIALHGFSTLPVDELVAVDEGGVLHGELLGRPGRDALGPAGAELLRDPRGTTATVTVSVHGPEIAELGLSCGGQADVLLQPADRIPHQVWERLETRAPAALITVVEGPGAAADAIGVGPDSEVWGAPVLDDAGVARDVSALVEQAAALLQQGRSGFTWVETEAGGRALLEAWVPSPRLVVVGTGDVVGCIEAQAGLIGWETRATETAGDLDELLDWAGATAALIVLSHDPKVDVPALAAGLARRVRYVGAMGSRGTQSRRSDRLRAEGITEEALGLIHKPIGLDLGGRRAPEVALSIVAEILAAHHGREAGNLRNATGPIHH